MLYREIIAVCSEIHKKNTHTHTICSIPLHNEQLHHLYCSPDTVGVIIWRRSSWTGHVARMEEEERISYRVLIWKSEGKIRLGRPRRRWANNIKTGLKEGRQVWTGFIRLRIGPNGGLLLTRWWTVGLHRVRGKYSRPVSDWCQRVRGNYWRPGSEWCQRVRGNY